MRIQEGRRARVPGAACVTGLSRRVCGVVARSSYSMVSSVGRIAPATTRRARKKEALVQNGATSRRRMKSDGPSPTIRRGRRGVCIPLRRTVDVHLPRRDDSRRRGVSPCGRGAHIFRNTSNAHAATKCRALLGRPVSGGIKYCGRRRRRLQPRVVAVDHVGRRHHTTAHGSSDGGYAAPLRDEPLQKTAHVFVREAVARRRAVRRFVQPRTVFA